MSWDFAVHGQVAFPDEDTLEAWLDAPIDQPGGVEGPLAAPVDTSRTVRSALGAFRTDELQARRKGRKVVLRGWVEKTAMIDLGPPLVGALFTAARGGATGGVWLIAAGNTLTYRITLAEGAATLREHDEPMEDSEMVAEAGKAVRRPFAATWLLPPGETSAESPDDHAFTVTREQHGKRLSDALAALRFGGKRKLTKGDIQKMLGDEAVRIDGQVGRSSDLLAKGQRVRIVGWGRLLGG